MTTNSALVNARRITAVTSFLAATVGMFGTLEWVLDVGISTRLGANGLPRFGTALSFILLGSALWLSREGFPAKLNRNAAKGLAVIVALCGLLGTVQHFVSMEIGPYYSFRPMLSLVPQPGDSPEMAFTSGLSLLLIAGALFFLDTKLSRNYWLGECLIFFTLPLNVDAAVGEALNPFTPMAELSNVVFVLLCLGVICARPDHGVMKVLTSTGPGGHMVRRLLPVTLILPPAIGRIMLSAGNARELAIEDSVSLLVLAIMVPMAIIVMQYAGQQDRAEAERAQAEGEIRRQVDMLDQASDAVMVLDPEERVTYWNLGAERIYGWTKEEVIGKHVHDLFRIAAPLTETMDALQQNGHWEGVLTHTRKDGTQVLVASRWTRWQPSADEPALILEINSDITERRRAQEALRESNEYFTRLMQALSDAVFTIKMPERRIEYVNSAIVDMFGYSPEEVVGKTTRMFYPTESDFRDYGRSLQAAIEERKTILTSELELLKRDGAPIWCEIVTTFLPSDGEHSRVISVLRDITRRKESHRRLRESEERYRKLVEDATDVIFTLDLDGKIASWNKAGERITGYSQGELLHSDFQALVAPDSLPRLVDQMQRARSLEGGSAFEVDIAAKDGRQITLETNLQAILINGGAYSLQGIARDVTERKTLEAQLFQAQKMEAVGQLAGGVAHDFNNLLGVVLGYCDLLLERPGLSEDTIAKIKQIQKSGLRGASLTRQLLAFSRKQVLQPEVVNLNNLITGWEQMLQRLIGEHIQVTIRLAPSLGLVKADPGKLEQILMNLAVNAKDAMPNGGKLIIGTSNADLDESYVKGHQGSRPGPFVVLSVSDTGLGMDKQTQARIFEPFFTTKEMGKGTGLGLSTVYGIVKQSEGFIWVYSEPGKGTMFKIYLPRVDAVAATPQEEKAPAGIADRHATILVVEDDESLRDVTRAFLESMGFTVLTAENGQEALRIAQHAKEIHIAVTDLVMPGMGGSELARQLAAMRPAIKILYVSGYTDDAIAHQGALDSTAVLLEKPFTKEALMKKVHEILEA